MEFYVKAEGTSESGFEEFISEVEKTFTTVSGQEYEAKIIWDGSAQTFDQNEARVIPVTITAPDRSGTYLYKIVIRKDDGTVYDERTFFVRTT
jgi:hypothetical protein